MIDTGYLYSKDDKRIFINTCLGCSSQCSYCYLKEMGYGDKHLFKKKIRKSEDLIREIEEYGISSKTLITLGCFSECWDSANKPETIKLIQYFLKKGNQIQLATKKEITEQELKNINDLIQYLGQLTIFISSATISNWSDIEKGTDAPEKRFKTFELSKKLNIPTVLYMKPILKDITIKDIEKYKDLIKKYKIKDVVVGSIFGKENTEERVHFSNKELFYNPISDELKIEQNLMQLGGIRVFSRSSQVIKYYKDKYKDRDENIII